MSDSPMLLSIRHPLQNQPALKAALLMAAGIIFVRYIEIPPPALWIASVGCVLISILLYTGKRTASVSFQICLIGSVLACAALRYHAAVTENAHQTIIRFANLSTQINLTGYLVRDPVIKPNRTDWIVDARTITAGDSIFAVKGRVLVSWYDTTFVDVKYGNGIAIRGRLLHPQGRRNPGGFDYRAYLARRSIHALFRPDLKTPPELTASRSGSYLLRHMIYPVRRFVIDAVERTTDGEARHILRALLTGDRGRITPELRDDFSRAGVIHVLAVSGLHVGFILMLATTLFRKMRLSASPRIFLTIGVVAFFAALTEAHAPVVRASIMASVYLVGTRLERRTNGLNCIGVAALTLLILHPMDLFDLGFQLSFTAVLSIALFYQPILSIPVIRKLEILAHRIPLGRYLISLTAISAAAQIGTLPLVAIYFNRIPLLSLPANILIVPLVGVIVALGIATVLAALASGTVAHLMGVVDQSLLTFLIKSTGWISELPLSHLTVPTPGAGPVILYVMLILLLLNWRSQIHVKRIVFAMLLTANGLVWISALKDNPNVVRWIQFDVGQGDSALLRLPRGHTMLIDGGDKTPYFDAGEQIIAPYLRRQGIRKLDIVVLTHAHNDHVGGLGFICREFDVGQFITSITEDSTQLLKNLHQILLSRSIPVQTILAPDSITRFPGVRIDFLWPLTFEPTQSENNRSVVLAVTYGKSGLLFMGDAELQAESAIMQQMVMLDCDVIKAGHHGSHSSSSQKFLATVSPDRAVISVGRRNRYRHPSDAVIRRFKEMEIPVDRTDHDGAVIFQTDGIKIKRIQWKRITGR